MSGRIVINGVNVKTPKSLSVQLSDLDGSTTRNANGVMIRDRIAVKRKLEVEWGPLSDSEISTILTAISDVFFAVEFPDPQTGGQITKQMYAGDRTSPVYSFHAQFQSMKWSGLKVNFIEQ
jgi:hypothetical protein